MKNALCLFLDILYVTENELPIQYYKEFGWNQVNIFAE